MKVRELREKNLNMIKMILIDLLREQFNLRMQMVNNQMKQTHLLKRVRRNIARVKTLLTEKTDDNEQ